MVYVDLDFFVDCLVGVLTHLTSKKCLGGDVESDSGPRSISESGPQRGGPRIQGFAA